MAETLQFQSVRGQAALPSGTNWVYNVVKYPTVSPGYKTKYRAYKYDGTIGFLSQVIVDLGLFDTQDLALAACQEDYFYLQQAASVASPSLSGLNPSSGPGNATTTVAIHGAGFDAGVMAQVTLADGVTTDQVAPSNAPTATDFAIQLPYYDIPKAGTVEIAVLNGSGKLSNSLPWTVTAPGPPVLSSMSPSAGAPNANTEVSLSGNGFDGTAVVLVGTTTVQPDSRSANSGLSFLMTAALVPNAGTYTVAVKNSDGTTSASLVFTAAVPPAIATLSPDTAPANTLVKNIQVNGAAFDPATVQVVLTSVDGSTTVTIAPDPAPPPSATSFQFDLAAANIPSAGTVQVQAQNGTGQISLKEPFYVT